MNLDETQKAKLKGWIDEGLKLSEIQSKMAGEWDLRLTYMDLRFLMADLGLQPKDRPSEAPKEIKPAAPPPKEEPALPAGKVRVGVDTVTRPGALVSGKVTFSDGKGADWYLDQMGRLGVVPKEQGYKPTEEDVMEFQAELQSELARLGY